MLKSIVVTAVVALVVAMIVVAMDKRSYLKFLAPAA